MARAGLLSSNTAGYYSLDMPIDFQSTVPSLRSKWLLGVAVTAFIAMLAVLATPAQSASLLASAVTTPVRARPTLTRGRQRTSTLERAVPIYRQVRGQNMARSSTVAGAAESARAQILKAEQHHTAGDDTEFVTKEFEQSAKPSFASSVAGFLGLLAAGTGALFYNANKQRWSMSHHSNTDRTPAHWSKHAEELIETARAIAAPGKGILAADESTGTIGKRFDQIGVENNEENRAFYREMLVTAPGLNEHISGMIMYEETLYQTGPSGKSILQSLKDNGIYAGIKVDTGVCELPGTEGESYTMGLDGLLERCKKYYADGARFAKWRAVLKIKGDTCPSEKSIMANATGLAQYAAICQQAGLVPIVEPEILMDGDHDIEKASKVAERVLSVVYRQLEINGVLLEGTLLKPNMVCPGADGPSASAEEVAYYTVRTFQRTVPSSVAGITFLSGGLSEEQASLNLNAINTTPGVKPWSLTFSYGRALQQSTLKEWAGNPENKEAAQAVLIERAKANGEAQQGKYEGGAGGDRAAASNYVKNYSY